MNNNIQDNNPEGSLNLDSNDLDGLELNDLGNENPEPIISPLNLKQEIETGIETFKITDGSKELLLQSSRLNIIQITELAKAIFSDSSFSNFLKLNNGVQNETQKYMG